MCIQFAVEEILILGFFAVAVGMTAGTVVLAWNKK